jgi:hypothetical protein
VSVASAAGTLHHKKKPAVVKRLCRLPMPYSLMTIVVVRGTPCNCTKNFEHETKRKRPIRKAKIKMVRAGWKICHAESRKVGITWE